jgi:hypothetical protein
MNVRLLQSILAAAGLCLVGGGAAADNQSVAVTFAGQVLPKCVLNNPNTAVDLGQLSQKGTASVAFTLSCNADFHFALSSRNGGFAQLGTRTQPPFIALIPYTVSLNLGVNLIGAPGQCISRNMNGPFPSCWGLARANIADPAAQNASLLFSWDFSGGVPLSGTFRDTVILTVGPDF